MTRWFDPVEQQAWNAIITLLNRLPSALDTQLQRESGITHFEFVVMTVLSQQPGHRLQMSALADKLNCSLSRLSHVVSKLDRLGLAKRSVTEGRRGVQAVLTERGYLTTTDATPGYLSTVGQLVFDGLDDHQKSTLAEIAITVRARLDVELGRPAEESGQLTR